MDFPRCFIFVSLNAPGIHQSADKQLKPLKWLRFSGASPQSSCKVYLKFASSSRFPSSQSKVNQFLKTVINVINTSMRVAGNIPPFMSRCNFPPLEESEHKLQSFGDPIFREVNWIGSCGDCDCLILVTQGKTEWECVIIVEKLIGFFFLYIKYRTILKGDMLVAY